MACSRRKHRLAHAALAIALSFAAAPAGGQSDRSLLQQAPNPNGMLGTLMPADAVAGHPFFQPLGSNGRACATCHRPASGFSLESARRAGAL